MGSAVSQGCPFADAQESRIQVEKRSEMGNADMKEIDLLMFRNSVFKLGNVLIWLVPSYKVVDLLIFRNSVFKLQHVEIWALPN